MNNHEWGDLESAFLYACGLKEEELRSWLEELELNDTALASEVKRLLLADEQSEGDVLFDPINFTNLKIFNTTLQKERLGPYELEEVLGEGGMGIVYLAKQAAPVKRKVAVKILRSQGSSRTHKRFELEVQALAMLNHPNIASIYGAGVTRDGLPYFAMEYVKGIPLDVYCDENDLGINERIKLFSKVCRTVHFAHEQGIIHRDLKPANVLVVDVEGDPQPKIIDFGIAKAANYGANLEFSFRLSQTRLTLPGMAVGTLGYMAPEQAMVTDARVDARADIFALGVILYELLVGSLPISEHEMENLGLDRIFKIIRERKPEAPSRAVIALAMKNKNGVDRRDRLKARQLRGEIDWLVLKALEKDPILRFGSALSLYEDCERYLKGIPIHARPPSAITTFKYIILNRSKNSLLFFLALFGVVCGLIGVIYGAKLAGDSKAEMDRQVSLAHEGYRSIESLLVAKTPQARGRERMLEDQLDDIHDEIPLLSISPLTQSKLYHTIGLSYFSVGETRKAKESLKTSLALKEELYSTQDVEFLETAHQLCLIEFEGANLENSLDTFDIYFRNANIRPENALIVIETFLASIQSHLLQGDMDVAKDLLQVSRDSIEDFGLDDDDLFGRFLIEDARVSFWDNKGSEAVRKIWKGLSRWDHQKIRSKNYTKAVWLLSYCYILTGDLDLADQKYRESVGSKGEVSGILDSQFVDYQMDYMEQLYTSGYKGEFLLVFSDFTKGWHARLRFSIEFKELLFKAIDAAVEFDCLQEFMPIFTHVFNESVQEAGLGIFEELLFLKLAEISLKVNEKDYAVSLATFAYHTMSRYEGEGGPASYAFAKTISDVYASQGNVSMKEYWLCRGETSLENFSLPFEWRRSAGGFEILRNRVFYQKEGWEKDLEHLVRISEDAWGETHPNTQSIYRLRKRIVNQ
ncbi:serine/threonine protein kinase [Acanthopleuribacter pedis]|uniref:Serine/threonine protein kinase n=1 Tax=Acanthopleuribacter pedis TaxID=442870 RepID=A0A8J7Q3R0_9BACT|nr:serine/threonine-protein kinase [Acanthopleuribacter pedis]MBO1317517.1 serine/threonine protein kinase [Acanthopleuribacter pedis]